MTAPYYPFDRSTRQSSVFTGNGTTKVFGPSTFKVWSAEDVEVWRKLPGEAMFSKFTGATIALTGAAPATFTITFPTAPVLNAKWYYKGRRLHERSTAIAKANQIDRTALDAELTRLGQIQQEHYRDLGQALKADPGVTVPAIVENLVADKLLVAGPNSAIKNGPSLGEIVDLRDSAAQAVELAESWANIALGYKNAIDLLAQTVLQAANLTESVLPTVRRFSPNGTQTDFDLENDQIDKRSTNVHISGVYQQKDTYSITNGILSFDDAPPAGEGTLEVVIFGSVAVSYAITQPPEGAIFIEIVNAVPPIANFEGRSVYLTSTGTFWTYTGGVWKNQGGSAFELPENASLIERVATPPVTGNFAGRVIYLTSDGKVYTFDGADWVPIASGSFELPPNTSLVERVAGLPSEGNYTGRIAYNLTDGKLYAYRGSAWEVIGGAVSGGPVVPDGAGYIYSYDELPTEGLYEGQLAYLTTNGKLYTWTAGAWKSVVTITDVNFPEGFTGIEAVLELPTTGNFEGRVVYLETDGKLWRYHNDAWSKAVDAADILGQITSTQITDNAITTPKIFAGAITAAKLAVNSVTADAILAGAILTSKIAAGAITTDKLAAALITADKIASGAVTAAKINVTSLDAISANLGSITVDTINLAGNAVTVQAGAETSGGVSVNASGFTQIQTVTVSWGSSASIWVFCQFKASVGDELEIDIRSGGVSLFSSPKSFSPKADGFSQYLDMFPSGLVSGAGITFWLRRTSSGTTTINARKMLVLAAKR